MYNSDRPTRVQVRPRVDISLKKQVGLGHAQHGNNSMWISSTCLRCQARSLVIPAMPQQSYQFTCTFVINVYLFKRRLRGCWREQGGTFHKYQNTKYELKIRPTKRSSQMPSLAMRSMLPSKSLHFWMPRGQKALCPHCGTSPMRRLALCMATMSLEGKKGDGAWVHEAEKDTNSGRYCTKKKTCKNADILDIFYYFLYIYFVYIYIYVLWQYIYIYISINKKINE